MEALNNALLGGQHLQAQPIEFATISRPKNDILSKEKLRSNG
jgi:hypothetical protein